MSKNLAPPNDVSFRTVFPGLRVYALFQKKWVSILVSFLNILSSVQLLVSCRIVYIHVSDVDRLQCQIQASQSGPGNSPLGVCRYQQLTSITGYERYAS